MHGAKFIQKLQLQIEFYLLALFLFLFLARWCFLGFYHVSKFVCGDILYHVSLFASGDQGTSILYLFFP